MWTNNDPVYWHIYACLGLKMYIKVIQNQMIYFCHYGISCETQYIQLTENDWFTRGHLRWLVTEGVDWINCICYLSLLLILINGLYDLMILFHLSCPLCSISHIFLINSGILYLISPAVQTSKFAKMWLGKLMFWKLVYYVVQIV